MSVWPPSPGRASARARPTFPISSDPRTYGHPFSVPGCIKGARPASGVFPVLEVRQSCTRILHFCEFFGIFVQALSCIRHRSRPDTYRAPAVFLSGHAGNPDLFRPDPVRLCDIGRLSHENRTGTWRGSHDIWRWPADVPPAPHHKFSTFIDPLSSDYLPNIARGPVEPQKELDHYNDDRQIFTGPPTFVEPHRSVDILRRPV